MTVELFSSILGHLFSPSILLLLVAGTFAGIVVGALPGLSATMAIALMIPVTFTMDPLSGITLLIAIYAGSMFGGSVPAILLHTPGTPSAAATAIDGYQLTRKGQGGLALGIAAIASATGGTLSAFALLFIAPPLARVSLFFSAPEYFLIAVFGLSIIASVVDGPLIKALAAGVLGLLIGTVGIDVFTGFNRFTFGVTELQGGVSLVPAMIGLFSMSQVLIQLEPGNEPNHANKGPSALGRILPTRAQLKSVRRAIFGGSAIGMGVGILPGAGGEIGSWVSYNEAKRFSKNKSEFGKGSLEGVAAPEAANNGVTGGAMIPLMTLGIPANIATAVLLGGFLIQGLTPGRSLFTQQAELTYSIILGFVLANIIMGILAITSARYLALISRISSRVITPLILGLSVVGAFAINNSLFDVWIMLAFGLVGYLGRKGGFHPAPIVLGMLLGPIAEQGFRQTMTLARVADQDVLSFILSRPPSLVLIAIILVAFGAPLFAKLIKSNMNKGFQPDTERGTNNE